MLINSIFKLVIFDMAGTIIKENNIVYKTLYKVLKPINMSITQKDINKFHGYNKKEVIEHFIKEKYKHIHSCKHIIDETIYTFNNILNIHTISITININQLIITDISKTRKTKLHKRVPETTYTLMIIVIHNYSMRISKKKKKCSTQNLNQ